MKIEVNIEKKYFYILLGAILILASALIINAFETSNPSNFGHSVGEIDWSQEISNLRVQNLSASGNISSSRLNSTSICMGNQCKTSWPDYYLASCSSSANNVYCTPSCVSGYTLRNNIHVSSVNYWTGVGLCVRN